MSDEKSARQLSSLIDRLLAQPQLLEAVATLVRDASHTQDEAVDTADAESAEPSFVQDTQEDTETTMDAKAAEEPAPQAQAASAESHGFTVGDRRHRLLSAIKPYLSAPRAKALDSIEAIADLMDVLKHA